MRSTASFSWVAALVTVYGVVGGCQSFGEEATTSTPPSAEAGPTDAGNDVSFAEAGDSPSDAPSCTTPACGSGCFFEPFDTQQSRWMVEQANGSLDIDSQKLTSKLGGAGAGSAFLRTRMRAVDGPLRVSFSLKVLSSSGGYATVVKLVGAAGTEVAVVLQDNELFGQFYAPATDGGPTMLQTAHLPFGDNGVHVITLEGFSMAGVASSFTLTVDCGMPLSLNGSTPITATSGGFDLHVGLESDKAVNVVIDDLGLVPAAEP